MSTNEQDVLGDNFIQVQQIAKSPKKNGKQPTRSVELSPPSEQQSSSTGVGRCFKRHFTSPNLDPFEQVQWSYRQCAITNDQGEIIFMQKDVEAPIFWSDMATKVVASKYLYGQPGTSEREKGIRCLISRVTQTIAMWAEKDNYFSSRNELNAFKDELSYILLHQHAAFNSPVWFNVGVQPQPQCSACFIVSVEDTMESLLELQKVEGKLFKFGSGTGTNLSTIRSSKEKLSGGGTPSGPVSFMRGFDSWAGIIKSGGKTRRAAKMQILNVDHPDILEFINCKQLEEQKAWALIEQGYDGSFAAPGGAYESAFFQNANLSVRVTDEFMQAVKNKQKYQTKNVHDGLPCEELDAHSVMEQIARGTYICGDPGLQFDSIINQWHTCPNSGRINSSNPCSEYMHLDNSACNLASINLLKYLNAAGDFDVESFKHTIDILITAQDLLINNSSYPTEQIGECAKNYRQLGLGYANLGAMLMNLGLPYDSDQGREWAGCITAIMTGQAYKTSASLAEHVGPFLGYEKNREPMLKVIRKHLDAASNIPGKFVLDSLKDEAKLVWEEALQLGTRNGYRNSQTTVLAPTGTISFMMDCDTTGIEPDLGLVKYKKLSDGGLLKIVNQSVSNALTKLGYKSSQISEIVSYIHEHDMIEGAPHLLDEHLPVFDCAFTPHGGKRSIHFMGHLRMMAAAQPFISGAISKTVNLPKDVNEIDIFNTYVAAWELGVKAVALYRDGSKRTQPLSAGQNKNAKPEELLQLSPQPVRRRLPDERQAITHKFNVGGLEGYLTVGLFEDGAPGEIFLVVAKEGSTLSGIMDAFATSISIALQYGVPLTALVKKFSHMRFEPSGFTNHQEIPMANSIVDYVFQWMANKFLSEEKRLNLGLRVNRTAKSSIEEPLDQKTGTTAATSNGQRTNFGFPLTDVEQKAIIMSSFENSADAPPCTNCGSSMMVRQAGCYVCLNCGSQGGCG